MRFQEDAIGIRLRDVIGVDNMMWGSDYPHSESTFPQSRKILAEILAGVPDDEQAKIAGGNTARVYKRCSGSVVIMETVRACTMPGAKLPPSLGKLSTASRGLARLVRNLDRDVRFRGHPDRDSYPLTSTTKY